MVTGPRVALLALLALGGVGLHACGACGCTLHSDWVAQGLGTQPGFRLDLRTDYFDQDQLRAGTGAVDRGALGAFADGEIQERTLNRNLTATLDYSPSPEWGIALLVPTFLRTHATRAEGDAETSFSRGRGLGDLRLVGRYQGFSAEHAFGVQVGLKLPTGSTRQTFAAGPQAGQPLDRALQLGTGTTDLLVGVYGFGELAPQWGVFAQALIQQPLAEAAGFQPGAGVNANLGLRYTGWAGLTPHLQVNLRAEGRETGPQADTTNSGATLIYLSPGLAVTLSRGAELYAFLQVPVVQRVTGLQLEPRWSASLGLRVTL